MENKEWKEFLRFCENTVKIFAIYVEICYTKKRMKKEKGEKYIERKKEEKKQNL